MKRRVTLFGFYLHFLAVWDAHAKEVLLTKLEYIGNTQNSGVNGYVKQFLQQPCKIIPLVGLELKQIAVE